MKNIIKSILALTVMAFFSSCADEQSLKFSEPAGTFAILSPQTGDAVILKPETPLNPGISLTWDAKDYGTPTEVTYTVQVDKEGDNFDTPVTLVQTTKTYATVTSEVLNGITNADGVKLIPFTQGGLEIRVKSTVGTTASQESFSKVVTYLVTPYSTDLPKLYLTGNFLNNSGYGANWTPANGVPVAASAYAKTDFQGFVNINEASYAFLFLPTTVNFDNKFGDDGTFSGILKAGGSDISGSGAGYYYVKADTTTLTYSLTKTSWGIIGFATTGSDAGWNSSTAMTYNSTTKKWEITLPLSAGDFKFRANNAWTLNLGKDGNADGSMDFDGGNLSVAAGGTYKVELDLSKPRKYAYTATLQ